MRVIKGLKDTYNILHDLCRDTNDSLLVLYGWTEPIGPRVAVIHRNRSEETYDDLNALENELTEIFNEMKNWRLFKLENLFLHGNFDEDEIRIIDRIYVKFQEVFTLTITVQLLDREMEGKYKYIIEDV